jgi:purine-binding chemotaxis protein CheW
MSTQLCSFQLAGMSFCVPAVEVQEIIGTQAITRVPLADAAVVGLINLRGQIVTSIDVRTRLGLDGEPATRPINVVVRNSDGVFSLLVDSIGDVLEPDDSQLDTVPETVPSHLRDLIAGVYKLPDRLLFVLDLNRIVSP